MKIIGFFTPWIIYAVITLLHLILPARKTKGYALHGQTGEALSYRLNGIPVLAASIFLWILLGCLKVIPLDWLYQVRWESLAGAVSAGLLFSFVIVLPFPSTGNPAHRSDRTEVPPCQNFFAELWLGRLKNPQFRSGLIDAKMWLYLTGAVMLQLNVISFAAHHWLTHETINPGFLAAAGLLTYFIWDYLTFENVHLYTYDFTSERTGFKLGFSYLSVFPFLYAVPLWSTVSLPNPGLPRWLSVCFALVFFSGWVLARGATMQKYFFKIAPDKNFFGIKPEAITDGERSLLANGFWGRSRHINYLGEILTACGVALVTGYPGVWQVWLYPFYLAVLLFTRQYNDNKICKEKYGGLWDAYTKKVKYRIIPFIY